MSCLRNLLLVICLGAFAGTTWVACASTATPANAPAAGEVGDPKGAQEPMSDPGGDAVDEKAAEDAEDAVDGAKEEGKDNSRRDLLGRDPCDPPVPE
jgi:hypothetical protein